MMMTDELVAYGAQIYLTGNLRLLSLKLFIEDHTNFSMESIEQIWNGAVSKWCVSATYLSQW